MEKFFRSLAKRIDGLRFLYNYSSWEWVRRTRARFGPIGIRTSLEVIQNPNTEAMGYCPHCANVILPDRIVALFWRDRTADDKEVKISGKQTLWVSMEDGTQYQVGCLPIDCKKPGISNALERRDLMGLLDKNATLIRVSGESKLVFEIVSIQCLPL